MPYCWWLYYKSVQKSIKPFNRKISENWQKRCCCCCAVSWNKLPIKEKQKNNLLHGFISNWNLSKKSQRKKKKKYKTKKFFPSFEINKNYMYLVFEFNQYDSGWKKNDTRKLLEITSQIIFHHYIFYCMYNMDLPVIHWWEEPYFSNKNL